MELEIDYERLWLRLERTLRHLESCKRDVLSIQSALGTLISEQEYDRVMGVTE